MVPSGNSPQASGRSTEKVKSTSNNGKKHGSSIDSPSSEGHRSPNTTDPVFLSIASRQAALVQQQITLTCYIPSNCVGAVIGKRGSTIAQIQRQSQQVGTSSGPVRLSIVGRHMDASGTNTTTTTTLSGTDMLALSSESSTLEQSPIPQQQKLKQHNVTTAITPSGTSSVPYTYSELDWSSPNWTPVVVRADPCATLMAAEILRDKVGDLDDVVMDVPLGRSKHAAVVGRRGFVLANLSADTNVRIMVPRRELRHDIIQLEGDLDNVKQCLDRILVIISENIGNKKGKAANSNSTNNNTASRQQAQDSKSDESISVVLNLPSLPSQTKLRSVGKKTNTLIKKKKAEGSWNLTISSSSNDSVQSAVAILKKWSGDNANNNNSNSNSNGNMNDDSSNNANKSGASARSRGRGGGRQQARNNNRNKGNRSAKANKYAETGSLT